MGSVALAEAHGEDEFADRIRAGMVGLKEREVAGARRRRTVGGGQNEGNGPAEEHEVAEVPAEASSVWVTAFEVGVFMGLDEEALTSALIALGGNTIP